MDGKLRVFALAFMVLTALPILAAEPTVNTGTGRDKTTDKKGELSRERAIDLSKTRTNTDTDAVEKIHSRMFASELLSQYTNKTDTQGIMLLRPFVAALELGQADFGVHPVADTFRRCGLFSYMPPLVSATPHSVSRPGLAISAAPGSAKRIAVFGNALDNINQDGRYVADSQELTRRFASPRAAVQCYMTYAYILSEATKEMASQAVGEKRNPKGASVYFLADALDRTAARALVAVIADPTTPEKITRLVESNLQAGCMLPTVAAHEGGDFSWSCGSLEVDPDLNTVKAGGVIYFGENTFLGVSALFSQVDAVALTSNLSDADIQRKSKAKEIASASEARLSKHRALTSGTTSTRKTTAESGVSQ